MNLGQYKTAVLTRMGLPTDDALLDGTALTALINSALRHIQTRHDWRWYETSETIATANADREYALPAGYRRTLAVVDADGEAIEKADIAFVERLVSASGPPKWYCVYGSNILFAPTPTAIVNLTHRYLGSETELAADGNSPTLPAVWDDAVVEYAAYLGFRRINSETDAGAALAAFEQHLEKMLAEADAYSRSVGGGHVPAAEAAATREAAKA